MIIRISLGSLRHTVYHLRHRLNKVFLMDQHKLLLLRNGQADHAMLAVKMPGFFDGVVQQIAEEGVDVGFLHKAQERAVHQAGKLDVAALADHALHGQYHVQRAVAGFHPGIILLDRLLDLLLFLFGNGLAHRLELVLQIVAFDVDDFHHVFFPLILFSLLFQDSAGHSQFLFQVMPLQHVEFEDDNEKGKNSGGQIVGDDDALIGNRADHGKANLFNKNHHRQCQCRDHQLCRIGDLDHVPVTFVPLAEEKPCQRKHGKGAQE